AGYTGEELRARGLIGVNIILQEFGVVVAHLLEVRHDPAFVDGIAVKSARQLVVDAAAGHLFERCYKYMAELFVAGTRILVDQQIKRSGMRELGRASEAAILRIEHPQR